MMLIQKNLNCVLCISEFLNFLVTILSFNVTEVNRRDYRAWYGLGQTYEIIRMYFFSLYYYKQAQQLRPNDSRMLIALGEAYDKLDKVKEAIKCFARARSLGDAEGIAILQLGK